MYVLHTTYPCVQVFEWYRLSQNGLVSSDHAGLRVSVATAHSLLRKTAANAIVGFSQGAGLAYHLFCRGGVDVVVLFSPALAFDSLPVPREQAGSRRLCVVVYDPADPFCKHFQQLPESDGATTFVSLEHQCGHAIPPKIDAVWLKLETALGRMV